MSSSLTPHEAASIANHLMAAKMFSLASCIMLFYDILLTFGEEVEKVWKQRFTGVTVLWFLNRYLSPLGYIVVTVSFHADWNDSVCNRYVLFPEALKVVTSATIGIIFALRLYSIYGQHRGILCFIIGLLMAQLAVKIWSFTDGTRVVLPPGLVGCILTGKSSDPTRFVFTWVAELVFDTAVFFCTLYRTLSIYRRHRHGRAIPLVKLMLRDGIIYFSLIFAANVVTVTLFLVLPADLKAVNASFSTLITSLMVSRLILNLRRRIHPSPRAYSNPSLSTPNAPAESAASSAVVPLTSTIIGNLGEPVLSPWDDGYDYHRGKHTGSKVDALHVKDEQSFAKPGESFFGPTSSINVVGSALEAQELTYYGYVDGYDMNISSTSSVVESGGWGNGMGNGMEMEMQPPRAAKNHKKEKKSKSDLHGDMSSMFPQLVQSPIVVEVKEEVTVDGRPSSAFSYGNGSQNARHEASRDDLSEVLAPSTIALNMLSSRPNTANSVIGRRPGTGNSLQQSNAVSLALPLTSTFRPHVPTWNPPPEWFLERSDRDSSSLDHSRADSIGTGIGHTRVRSSASGSLLMAPTRRTEEDTPRPFTSDGVSSSSTAVDSTTANRVISGRAA